MANFAAMAKNKLQHFAELETFPNVVQLPYRDLRKGFDLKGKWREHFENEHPLVLELGCGKGEYTLGLAKAFPRKNFIGIDIKGARIWRGAQTALAENINNVAFLRSRIDFIESCFEQGEVDEIWITFPDPQPQKNRVRKRLTSPMFLNRYKNVLKPKACINLKSDSTLLHDYTLEIIKEQGHELLDATDDLYKEAESLSVTEGKAELTSIQTFYEQRWLKEGKKIKYVRFRLK